MARVYETFVVLLLLTLLVLGMVWVASAIVDNNAASRENLYSEFTLLSYNAASFCCQDL